jgi:hypothetical protein
MMNRRGMVSVGGGWPNDGTLELSQCTTEEFSSTST